MLMKEQVFMLQISKTPLVSVVMSTYNNAPFLPQAIESILAQTWKNLEFIIINDASTDNTKTVLEQYTDNRIRRLDNKQNCGLAGSLNIGLAEAKGHYIARMDSDDIAFPDRLEKQVAFLEKNPDIDILGTQRLLINEAGDRLKTVNRAPIEHNRIVWSLLVDGKGLIHPTVLFRASIILDRGAYNPKYTASQDLDLWLRNITYARFSNLDEPLLYYRVHSTSKSFAKTQREYNFDYEIRLSYLNDLLRTDHPTDILDWINYQFLSNNLVNKEAAISASVFLMSLLEELKNRNIITQGEQYQLHYDIAERIVFIGQHSPKGREYWLNNIKIYLKTTPLLGIIAKAKLFMRGLLPTNKSEGFFRPLNIEK